jgi:hypothetical protein
LHPGTIAEQRVDLAVVRKQSEGLGKLPGGEGVGRVALVIDGQRGLVVRIAQVEEERGQLVRREHALVDQRAR